MKLILKKVDLEISAPKKKYFKDFIHDINEFGGGYCSSNTSGSSKVGNIITSNLSCISLKRPLETGHTYLFGMHLGRKYQYVHSFGPYRTGGVYIAEDGDKADKPTVKIVTDDPASTINFTTHPYIGFGHYSSPAIVSEWTSEIYCYDITGYDTSKFLNLTYKDLQRGHFWIYEDE